MFHADGPVSAKCMHLQENKALLMVNLYDNSIGCRRNGARGCALGERKSLLNGSVSVRSFEQENKSLTELRVRDNGIGDAGATALAGTLRVSRIIRRPERAVGGSVIAVIAQKNRVLTSLTVM